MAKKKDGLKTVLRGLQLGKSLTEIQKKTGFTIEEIRKIQADTLRDRETFLQDSVLEMNELVEIAKASFMKRANGGSGSVVSDFIRLRANLVDMFNNLADTTEYYEALDHSVLIPFQRSLLRAFVDTMRNFLGDLERDVPNEKAQQRLRTNIEEMMQRFADTVEGVYADSLTKTATILGIEAQPNVTSGLSRDVGKAKKKKPLLQVVDGGF